MGLFNFIECAVAQANINRCGKELDKEEYRDITMNDVASVAGVIKDLPLMGYKKAAAIHFGDDTPLTDEETANAKFVSEILAQQTSITPEEIPVASAMIAKVQSHNFNSASEVLEFLKSSGKSDENIALYNRAIVALSNTPWYSQSLAMQDQSIVDGIQEVVGQMTPQHIPPQQTGFQVPPQFVTPVAPNAIAK